MNTNKVVPVIVLCLFLGAPAELLSSEPVKRTTIAEGEYRYTYPSSAARGEAREKWALFRDGDGYLVESRLEVRSEGDSGGSFVIAGSYWLKKDLTLIRWEQRLVSGPQDMEAEKIGCELSSKQLRCWIGTHEGRLAVSSPYEVWPLGPFTPWFFMSLVLRGRLHSVGEKATVTWVVWEVPDGPDQLTVGQVEITYLGQEGFHGAGVEFDALKFQFRLRFEDETHPPFTIWVMPEGILVALQNGDGFGVPILAQYKKYAEFGPGR